jgi:hypothetical protein
MPPDHDLTTVINAEDIRQFLMKYEYTHISAIDAPHLPQM